MDNMRQQAEKNGSGKITCDLASVFCSFSSSLREIIDDDVVKVTRQSDQSFQLSTRSGSEFIAKSLILATGAQSLWLNARNEETFQGSHSPFYPSSH
jgi:thioredoxin reductase